MKQGFIVIALIVLVVLGVIAWYWFETRPPGGAEPAAVTETVQEAPDRVPGPAPEPEAPPFVVDDKQAPAAPPLDELPLPPLAESDGHAQETLAGVVGEAAAMQQFASEGLVSRTVATVDALGSRQVPGNLKAVQPPPGTFAADPDPNPPSVILNEAGDPMPQYLSDPANARRYLAYVEMLEALDAEQFTALYRKNYPLFQQAWRELGYTDIDFNDRLLEIIDELLATPAVEEPVRLIKPEAVYLFADEELESLSAGQKILIRMGSENAARVKSKLSEFRQAIE